MGHILGEAAGTESSRILFLKSCAGNRALGWDLLPPGSSRFQVTHHRSNVTWMYAGYKDLLHRWKNGTQPKKVATPNDWYAGKQYDEDVARTKYILKRIGRYYPGTTDYQVAGFFWWHGNKDSKSTVYSKRYRLNLVRLIKQLRHDFQASHAKFVCTSLGETRKGSVDNGGLILKAMQQVDGRSGRYPKFARNVASVYTYWLTKGNGNSGNHCNLNAETFMNNTRVNLDNTQQQLAQEQNNHANTHEQLVDMWVKPWGEKWCAYKGSTRTPNHPNKQRPLVQKCFFTVSDKS